MADMAYKSRREIGDEFLLERRCDGSTVQLWRTDDDKIIRITIYRNARNGSLEEDGQLPLNFEYQFNYRELADGIKSYDTLEGMHRIDYLPFTGIKDGRRVGNYVLVENEVPEGYEPAKPQSPCD